MPSDTLTGLDIAKIVRTVVQQTISQAAERARVTATLTGAVEDLDSDLDIVYVRMDQEAMGGNPYMSDNYGAPGIIPATRVGETSTGEQVRVEFNGSAGATAQRTSVESKIILPFGATSGPRIIIDGDNSYLEIAGNTIVRLDTESGLRLRDLNDMLRVQLSPTEGLIIRHADTGVSGLIATDDGIIVVDPDGGDRISITSGDASATPTPKWAGHAEPAVFIDGTHPTPAVSSFDTGDDILLRFVSCAGWENLGTQTYTPPAGHTERSDVFGTGDGLTLVTSSATKDPSDTSPSALDFVNSHNNWWRAIGHTVVVRGGGASSPVFRSVTADPVQKFTSSNFIVTAEKPPNAAQGDMMVAHVTLASTAVPIGWNPPDGWQQLGVMTAGLGTPNFLGSGIWYKRVGPTEDQTQLFSVSMANAALTKVHVTVHAIQNPYAFPAGLDIRRNNRSMPRGLVTEATPITSSTTDWAYSSLPQTIISKNDVPLLAGRKYRVSFYCTSILTTLTDGNAGRWSLTVERDGGSGFTGVLGIGQRERYGAKPSAFTYDRDPMAGDLDYVPPADETADWRVRLNHLGGINYSVQLEASGTGPIRFWFEDIGAIY